MADIYPGEKGFKIEISIKDESNAAINLTGASIVYQMENPNGTNTNKTATIDNAATGITSYTTTDVNDFTQTGVYKIQPKITLSNGDIFYGSIARVEVKDYYK